ncbi:hypothetical protein PTKIN_Ptkin08bG0083400 [Pterospermum kingtungense]
MAEDIKYKLKVAFGSFEYCIPKNDLKNHVLLALEQPFNNNSSSLSEHKLPAPTHGTLYMKNDKLIHEELSHNLSELHQQHLQFLSTFNEEHMQIYQAIRESIDNNKGGMFFIYGHGGIGKTYLWNTLSSAIRSTCKIVHTIAFFCIALLLHLGGRTTYSRFKIPLNINNSSTCQIKKGTQLEWLIQNTSLKFWNEGVMVHKNCFEALDKSLRDVLKDHNFVSMQKPFRGKTVVLGRDLRQILLIVF